MQDMFLRETRKFPNVLMVDFGTLFAKVSVMCGGVLENDLLVVRNELYYLSGERLKYLNQHLSGTVNLQPGYYTLKEIEDQALLFQVEEIYVQTNAIPHSVDRLCKAYQNICEQVDQSHDLPIKITNNYQNWVVVVAIAAFETAETRASVEAIHLQAFAAMGFQAAYINNQLLFDYLSQLNYLKSININGYCIIVNIGGGDTEVAVVSGLPNPNTYRRFALGGQDIFKHIHNALRERYRLTGVMGQKIEEWLSEGGTVLEDAPPTKKEWKRMKIDITDFLNAPGMLFDYVKYCGIDRQYNSVIDVITSSIEAIINQSEQNIGIILSGVVLVGGAAQFRGMAMRVEQELKKYFTEFTDQIHVFIGENPQFSGINGIRTLVEAKFRDEGLLFTILPHIDTFPPIVDWQMREKN